VWPLAGIVLCAALAPGAPRAAPPPSSEAAPPDVPDDELIEFLGADDVGDAAWWDFLKTAPPRGDDTPAPQPEDAKR
jgi:hypothetical protein